MITNTNRGIPLRYASNANVLFYAERNFYYSVQQLWLACQFQLIKTDCVRLNERLCWFFLPPQGLSQAVVRLKYLKSYWLVFPIFKSKRLPNVSPQSVEVWESWSTVLERSGNCLGTRATPLRQTSSTAHLINNIVPGTNSRKAMVTV